MPFGDWFQPDIEVSTRGRVLIEHRVMISLAGYEAEEDWLRRHHGRDATPAELELLAVHSQHDRGNAWDLAEYACGSLAECEAFVEWLRQRVVSTMQTAEYRVVADALAAALVERGRLSWVRPAT